MSPISHPSLFQEDLSKSEFDQIWRVVDKFPDAGKDQVPEGKRSKKQRQNERIDVDSFVKLYRAIDDLFEEDTVEDFDVTTNPEANGTPVQVKEIPIPPAEKTIISKGPDTEDDDDDPVMEEELESIFKQLCDAGGLLSKEKLRAWDEVNALFKEGLLGEDEFNRLWDGIQKSPGATDKLDDQGFLYFNVALDDLFEFDEEATETENEFVDKSMSDQDTATPFTPLMVTGDDLSPDILFIALANEDGLVGREELNRWSELQDMLEEGDILESELDEIYAKVTKSDKDSDKVEEVGFTELFEAIDDLFEDESDDHNLPSNTSTKGSAFEQAASIKDELSEAINLLKDDDFLPCGLDALETEQKEIMGIVNRLEMLPSNLVRSRQGNINSDDMCGTWELIYSSSSSMKFNKGLSGLGGSFPNGKFSTLKQKLTFSKFMSDVEYTEHIEVTPSSASFDVTVTGSWSLRKSISLFTGQATIILAVEPDRVSYGPTSTRADHWKSLGPMNYLDLLYLDDDLRIMRGNTSMNTIFILRRLS